MQHKLESKFIHQQDSIEKNALQKKGSARVAFLTNYSKAMGILVYQRWVKLGNELVTKYNDGYVKENGHIKAVPYPAEWREYIIRQNPEKHRITSWKQKNN